MDFEFIALYGDEQNAALSQLRFVLRLRKNMQTSLSYSAFQNPARFIATTELQRWGSLRDRLVFDLSNDFPDAANLARQYFAASKHPSFSELMPLLFRSFSDDSCEPYDSAWIMLYVTSAIMDDLHDGDIDNNINNNQSVQVLSVIAASRATAVFGGISEDVEFVLRRSLQAQILDMSALTDERTIHLAAQDKNSLLSLPSSLPFNEIKLNKSQQKGLQFILQALDDITDIQQDALSRIQTTICSLDFFNLSEEQILFYIASSGKLQKLLFIVNRLCKLILEDVHDANAPMNCFLNEVSGACVNISAAADLIYDAENLAQAKPSIDNLRNTISIYAIST